MGAGCSEHVDEYRKVQQLAFALLFNAGRQFARLSDSFSELVHGGGGWHNQPIQVGEQILYRNTFKTNRQLNPEERLSEYNQRVQHFLNRGGSFDSIVLLNEETVQTLVPWSHYDYVMLKS